MTPKEQSVEVPVGVAVHHLYRCPEHGLLPRSATHLAFFAEIGSDELACTYCGGDARLVEPVKLVEITDLPAIRAAIHADVRERLEKWIAYLRSEARSGRELADQSDDPREARKYRIRAGSYEWAADGFEHDLDTALPSTKEEGAQDGH